MDKYSVEALIKETLIYYCRNYVGDAVEFKLDGLICITVNSEPVDTVFKIHEIISGKDDSASMSVIQKFNSSRRKCKRKFHGKYEISESGDEAANDFDKENHSDVLPGDENIGKKIKVEYDESYSTEERQLEADNFACGVCSNFKEVSKQFIVNHLLDDHMGQDDSVCFCMKDGCQLGFPNEEQYIKHFQTCHGSSLILQKKNLVKSMSVKEILPNSSINSAPIFPISSRNLSRQQTSTVNVPKNIIPSEISTSGLEISQENKTKRENENNASSQSDSNDESSQPRQCHLCGSEFPDFSTFDDHAHSEHGFSTCPYCDAVYQRKSARDSHVLTHLSDRKLLECNKCQLIFSRPDSLKRHVAKCQKSPCSDSMDAIADHSQNGIPVDGGLIESTLSALLSGSEELSQGFNSTSASMEWMAALDHENCHLKSDAIEVGSDQEEILPEDLNFSLEGTSSFKRSGRRRHTKYITTLDPERCFTCEVCLEFVPGGVDAFKQHCSQLHQRVPCPYCGCTYTQKASMERHQRQHTGERPYICTLCPRSYTRKENLHMHTLRFHSGSDEIMNLPHKATLYPSV